MPPIQEAPQPMAQEKPKPREITLPEEPETSAEGSFELIFRMPETGERVSRRFLKTDTVQILYDFIDHLQIQGKCKFETEFTEKYQVM